MVEEQVQSEQQQVRTMIAYIPTREFSERIAIPGGVDPSQIHLSIITFDSTLDFAADQKRIHAILTLSCISHPPLDGTISGIGRFTNTPSGTDTFYASVDVHHLHKLHDNLMKSLLDQGIPVSKTFPYIPHFTLANIPPEAPLPEVSIPNLPFGIDRLYLVHGDMRQEFLLLGNPYSLETEEECMNLDDLPKDAFEYLTKAQRDNIDHADFAWPDAPGGPKYPCHDQAHLDAAAKLIGRAPANVQSKIKRRAKAIAKRKGLSLPDSWKNETEDETELVGEAKWTAATRKAYLKEHPENFAGPDGSFPIKDASDVNDAWRLAGHADNPDAVRSKIRSIAKRLGLTSGLPDTADKKETTEASFQPRPRIAQLKVRFLSDNAISRNGRQYPTETVHNLVSSGQRQLESGDIINSYICHSVADEDNPLVVAGKASKIWHENNGAYALFDIPDTATGRDMVALLSGGYIPPTMSLRASNAEMRVEKGKGIPQVVGNDITLQGIDFTSRPGIEDARIQDLVLEHTGEQPVFQDSFFLEQLALVEEENPSPSSHITINLDGKTIAKFLSKEAMMELAPQTTTETTSQGGVEELHPNQILTPMVSGNSQGVSNDTPGSEYTRKYPQIKAGPPEGLTDIGALAGGPPEGLTNITGLAHSSGAAQEAHRAIHDHAASALGMNCAPGTTKEAGRKLNHMNEAHLVAIHDTSARHLNLDCAGSYRQMQNPDLSPGMNDDDDNMESVQKPQQEKKNMSVEEALALLKQNNYNITPPKTEAEKMQEMFEQRLVEQKKQFEEQTKALQEAQEKQLEEMKSLLTQNQQATTQRKSLVENTATNERLPENPRAKRSHIQEQLLNANWEELADRSCPLPEGVTAEHILKHFGQLMILQYNDKYGSGSIQPAHS